MSIVKDMSLAESGRTKIQWVRSFMPALSAIEERFEREKPFAGLRIAVSVHLEAKTANLGLVLAKGGAEVHLTGCNPLSTQDDVAAGIASMGVDTYGIHGVTPEEYEDLLVKTLACHPHLIVDDGGDLINLIGGSHKELGDCLIGGCEETTTGILRLKAREREGILPCPMMAVNDAKAKHYYDNKYGTGQSVMDRHHGHHQPHHRRQDRGRRRLRLVRQGRGYACQGHGRQRHRHRDRPVQGSGRHHERLPGHAHGRGRQGRRHLHHHHRL